MYTKMALKNILACPIICSIFCLMFAELPLIFICPILELQKLRSFDEHDIPYNKYIEYTYLSLTFFQLLLAFLVFCCCCYCSREDLSKEFSLATILWLIIPIIYTIFTTNELGDIPFYCPQNYDYKDPGLRYVCQTRLANLICMWVMFMGILLTGITMIIPKETLIDIFNDDGDEEYQAFNNSGSNRNGYQSVKQNNPDYRQIQIVRHDEQNDSLSNEINGMGRSESESSKRDKPKGKEETFGFNNDDLQKFIDQSDDNDKLKHVV
ncbi:hypothetical protein RclHR1_02690013 [Rhizophagus clarus]|uniref:Transmembrane protein n=1 Tax=Rhizophagus clarus TaxID=94130 RepID=A0A2Z6RW00_9GLOM|nr:hypothetical protein RclHR1_02690013 [Rhizophagus clarus]